MSGNQADAKDMIIKQKCEQCSYTCENTRDLKAHVEASHKQTCEKCDFVIHTEEQRKKHMLVRHDGKGEMLWVSDSILSNVDFDYLSMKTNKRINKVKAYSATNGENARFPN